jgi:uncharacterized membrane protein YcaP (DUF421 family)
MNSSDLSSMPWWLIVLRAALAYIGLLGLMRLAGKRSFSGLSSFDVIVLVLVGGTLRTAIVGSDNSMSAAFIGVCTILALDRLIGAIAARCPRFTRMVEGMPTLLVECGHMLPGVLRKNDIPEAAFRRALHDHGLQNVDSIEKAWLEPNGQITIIPRQGRAPSSPSSHP